MKKSKYLTKVDYYNIRVSINELNRWQGELMNNKPLAPEIIGLLLGRATV